MKLGHAGSPGVWTQPEERTDAEFTTFVHGPGMEFLVTTGMVEEGSKMLHETIAWRVYPDRQERRGKPYRSGLNAMKQHFEAVESLHNHGKMPNESRLG